MHACMHTHMDVCTHFCIHTSCWLSIGGVDDNNLSFVVNSSMTEESNVCLEYAVARQTIEYSIDGVRESGT